MKYYIDFLNIENNEYRLEFITPATGSDKELKLTSCEISWEGKDDIFEPLKISGLTATIFTSGYLFDLYQAVPVNVQCILYKGEDIYWQGFVTPNVYNQPAYEDVFELSIDAVDSLSILEFFPYATDARDVRSFKDIITNCFSNIPQDLTIEWPSVLDFSNLYISEQNFFSEEDEAWTCQEVLEEIARYCNLTIVQIGSVIKFLDYDTLDNEIADSIVYTGATVSLADTYNKISIESSTYNLDNYLPDLDDGKTYITTQESMQTTTYPAKKYYVFQELRHPKFKTHSFSGTTNTEITLFTLFDVNNFGCWFVRELDWEQDKTRPVSDSWNYYFAFRNVVCKPGLANFTKPSGSPNAFAYFYTQSCATKPIITIKTNQPIVLGNGYIAFNMETWFGTVNAPVQSDSSESRKINHDDVDRSPYADIRFKVGDYYLKGDSLKPEASTWTTTESWYRFRIGNNDDRYFNSWLNIKTNTDAASIIELDGCAIPLNQVVYGDLEVSIRAPYVHPDETFWGFTQQPFWTFIKNLKVSFGRAVDRESTAFKTIEETEAKDILWETIIDESYISELSTINLKINTTSNKDVSFSDVITKESGSYEYLATVDKGQGKYPMEQYKLNSYYEQLKAPRKQLDVTLKGLHTPEFTASVDDQKYVINASAMDLLNNQTTLNIVEKG